MISPLLLENGIYLAYIVLLLIQNLIEIQTLTRIHTLIFLLTTSYMIGYFCWAMRIFLLFQIFISSFCLLCYSWFPAQRLGTYLACLPKFQVYRHKNLTFTYLCLHEIELQYSCLEIIFGSDPSLQKLHPLSRQIQRRQKQTPIFVQYSKKARDHILVIVWLEGSFQHQEENWKGTMCYWLKAYLYSYFPPFRFTILKYIMKWDLSNSKSKEKYIKI